MEQWSYKNVYIFVTPLFLFFVIRLNSKFKSYKCKLYILIDRLFIVTYCKNIFKTAETVANQQDSALMYYNTNISSAP